MITEARSVLDYRPSREPLSGSEFNNVLNFVVSHENRMLMAAVLGARGVADKPPIGVADIIGALNKAQKDPFGANGNGSETLVPDNYALTDNKTFWGFCQGLIEADLVEEVRGSEKQSPKYAARSREKAELLLGAAGVAMPWSLYYEDVSVKEILGPTAPDKSGHRTPETWYTIYHEIQRSGEGQYGAHIVQSMKGRGYDWEGVTSCLHRLSRKGILEHTKVPGVRSSFWEIAAKYKTPISHLSRDMHWFAAEPDNPRFMDDALAFLRNPGSVSRLLSKAEQTTRYGEVRRQEFEALSQRIFSVIASNGGMKVEDVQSSLAEEGVEVSSTTLSRHLIALRTGGRVALHKVGQRHVYTAKPNLSVVS